MTEDEEHQADVAFVRSILFRSAVMISLCMGILIGILVGALGIPAWVVLVPVLVLGVLWLRWPR
jgi:hypothetical protein